MRTCILQYGFVRSATMNPMAGRQGRCDGAVAIGRLIEPPTGFEDPAIAISEQRSVMIAYGSGTKGPADFTRRVCVRVS